MEQTDTKLKLRHYPLIKELSQESRQDISEQAMRRRCIALSLLQEYQCLPKRPSLVPSADGALEGLLLTIPAYAVLGPNNPLWNIYQDLILKLPAYTKLHILAHESVCNLLEEWLQNHKMENQALVHTVPDSIKMTVWAEDDFELVQDKADSVLYMVQPHSNRRTGDENAAFHTSKVFEWPRVKVPVYFEGGNILVGDNFFLIGADYAVDTYLDMNGSMEPDDMNHLSRAMSELYGKYLDSERKLFLVGSTVQIPSVKKEKLVIEGEEWTEEYFSHNSEGTVQPIFHIDMFITLAGRNQEGKYQLLVGDPRMAAEMLKNDFMTRLNPDAFDDIANLLSKLGFDVIRNPLPLVHIDDPEVKLRKWYYATYNNALVEIKSPEAKTVWLPTYGYGCWEELKRTDEENKRIWEKLGFNVIYLADFHPFVEFSGSVHCIKKYVRRQGVSYKRE
ncbi:hypothetical protein ABID22_003046 [Pontibacter aydingkolensis]|uniref:Uncharacterized protein n=1 Tax=Pontibacter aydingkolensis TaxID=1911536 RepID=A0ABS7CXU9_9BACT|nr:hypothetical protein [Pontibacter aydingkolensis]MBW7468693.1 hypothetical protein [Pontibacter aydingkolensis]